MKEIAKEKEKIYERDSIVYEIVKQLGVDVNLVDVAVFLEDEICRKEMSVEHYLLIKNVAKALEKKDGNWKEIVLNGIFIMDKEKILEICGKYLS